MPGRDGPLRPRRRPSDAPCPGFRDAKRARMEQSRPAPWEADRLPAPAAPATLVARRSDPCPRYRQTGARSPPRQRPRQPGLDRGADSSAHSFPCPPRSYDRRPAAPASGVQGLGSTIRCPVGPGQAAARESTFRGAAKPGSATKRLRVSGVSAFRDAKRTPYLLSHPEPQ